MKKFFYILISFFVLASCSSDADLDVPENKLIVFDATVETRGYEMTKQYLEHIYATAMIPDFTPQGFWLKTYFEDEEFALGEDGNYYSNPPYYYPSTLPINFFLYSPSEEELGFEFCWDDWRWDWEKETGYWERDCFMYRFSPNQEISKQQDFLFTIAAEVKGDDAPEAEKIVLEHLLTQVLISARSESLDYVYRVAGVKLSNIVSVGNLNTSSMWDLYYDEFTEYVDTYSTPVTLTSVKQNVMNPDSGNAFLLPQTLRQDATLAVYLQVCDLNGNKLYPSGNDEYAWVSKSISGEWYQSNKYEYKLDFTTWFESQQME